MNVIFFGTPEFAAKVLTFLLQKGINVVAVITKPDKAQGRSSQLIPTPVKCVALAQNPPIPVFQPAIVSVPEFAETLSAFKPDLFVVVAYGEIIKQHLLDMPALGCINLHGSLLPQYRGAAPIQRAIMNGEQVTGVTIIHMVKKMDAGDMLKKVEVSIPANATFPEIESELCKAGSQALLDVICQFGAGTVHAIPQDHEKATFAPKVELEDCELYWHLPAQQLHNLIRAVTPEPAAWCYVTVRGQKKRLKVYSTQVVADRTGVSGTILSYNASDGLIVACGQQAIKLLSLQLEGKRLMSADEFMRGIPQDQLSFS